MQKIHRAWMMKVDIMEQILYTISYVIVQGKYLFLPCSVLKILLERFMKLNL